MMGILPINSPLVERDSSIEGQGPHKFFGQTGIIVSNPFLRHVGIKNQKRPAGEIQRCKGQRLIHRYIGAPETTDSPLISQRLPNGLA